MKRNAQSSKKSKDTAFEKRAENNISIVTCSIILYTLILFMIQSMSSNAATVAGADTVRLTLTYAGVVSGMLIASFAAYKSNKSLIKYSAMCFFVSISMAGIVYGAPWGMRATVVALAAAFVFVFVYAVLTDKKLFYSSKKTRTVFKTSIAVVYGILFALVVYGIVFNAIAINNAKSKPFLNRDVPSADSYAEVLPSDTDVVFE